MCRARTVKRGWAWKGAGYLGVLMRQKGEALTSSMVMRRSAYWVFHELVTLMHSSTSSGSTYWSNLTNMPQSRLRPPPEGGNELTTDIVGVVNLASNSSASESP